MILSYLHAFNYPRRSIRSLLTFPILAALYISLFLTACDKSKSGDSSVANMEWVGTWSTSQHFTEPRNMPAEPGMSDNTIRQVVHVSLGGERLRVRLSNAFGTDTVTIDAAHIAAQRLLPGITTRTRIGEAQSRLLIWRMKMAGLSAIEISLRTSTCSRQRV